MSSPFMKLRQNYPESIQSMKNMSTNKNFFDSISYFYDEMIGFGISLKNRIDMYKKILSPGLNIAADFGCGTGLDSIALCKNGFKVTAFDISPGMIELA